MTDEVHNPELKGLGLGVLKVHALSSCTILTMSRCVLWGSERDAIFESYPLGNDSLPLKKPTAENLNPKP